MTDIEKKALALLNEVLTERGVVGILEIVSRDHFAHHEALCRAIEQHEAFRQEVSDALQWHWKYADTVPTNFEHFIIAKPVDPLAECLRELELSENDVQASHDAAWLVKTLAKRGGKIVWEEE